MPRTLSRLLPAALAALLAPAPAALARQAPDAALDRGAALYREGDVKGAVREFRAAVKRRPEDHVAWVLLGQALVRRGELKEGRKAYEAALKLRPDQAGARAGLAYLLLVAGKSREAAEEAARALALDAGLADAHYVVGLLRLREGAWLKALEAAEAIIKLNPATAPAYSLQTQALLGLYERGNNILSDERRGAYDFGEGTIAEARAAQPRRLQEAAESLEQYLRLSPKAPDAGQLREELDALRFYAEAAASTDPARRIYPTSTEGMTRATIRSKPEPGFTEEARRAGVTGVVRLRVVLGADGTVKYPFVLRRLSHGLTEKAVAAARKIKFSPATLNGQPVSQAVVLEYNFNIY